MITMRAIERFNARRWLIQKDITFFTLVWRFETISLVFYVTKYHHSMFTSFTSKTCTIPVCYSINRLIDYVFPKLSRLLVFLTFLNGPNELALQLLALLRVDLRSFCCSSHLSTLPKFCKKRDTFSRPSQKLVHSSIAPTRSYCTQQQVSEFYPS